MTDHPPDFPELPARLIDPHGAGCAPWPSVGNPDRCEDCNECPCACEERAATALRWQLTRWTADRAPSNYQPITFRRLRPGESWTRPAGNVYDINGRTFAFAHGLVVPPWSLHRWTRRGPLAWLADPARELAAGLLVLATFAFLGWSAWVLIAWR